MKKRTLIFMVAAIAIIVVAAFLMPPDDPARALIHQLVTHVEVSAVEARFWEQLDGKRVRCLLCVHYCIIPAGRRGICRVRENIEGRLYTLVYGLLASTMIAPIEKDGMQHALPGTDVLAIATAGCNFRCKQCHNWHITQRGPEEVRARRFTPQEVVDFALRRGARTITGTINEPTVFFEFLYDVAILAREAGLRMQFHTNAGIAEEPLRALLKRVDQVVVDLKGFCPAIYREYYGGCLEGVLRTLKIIREEGAWLEITNLVIPTVNDCMDQIRAMSEWIIKHLGPDVPLHFTRFVPAFKLTHLPRTPITTLEMAHRVAREAGINFVTIGNVPGHRYNSTFCPCTGERLIHRIHFHVIYNKIVDGRSPFSGRPVPGIWE
ncbi:AmmeMemoRadiSam system radical SAM enzyme [Candidatus Acetothermia bacterium]|jgi:pyruvate formate lyase activating enzyme|nr:AmmeMemoRadiSam system radical SAM enzyme [Candidatus Acetothermia bacterium]MCI2426523.1 AmmeMemoRadiSam system radical SAM enzyme [Candidatus Acetothermia bacterium]